MEKKQTCIFIDHIHHKKTKSTQFLLNVFQEQFETKELWINDFSETSLQALVDCDCDLYVVFQYDFLAIYLLSHGKKVISVPMYDGTGEMHFLHWEALKGALVIDYSQYLYRLHVFLGLHCLQQQYYLPVAKESNLKTITYNSTRVFFWERSPSSGLNVLWLSKKLSKLSPLPTHVHLHLSADPTEYSSIHKSQAADLFPYAAVTTSSWFESKKDYFKTLCAYNVFVASREFEGIGMSFLEAMSLGMLVIGLDRPTLNEYIDNGRTGFLLADKFDDFPLFSKKNIKCIGGAAKKYAYEGYEYYKKEKVKIYKEALVYIKAKGTSQLKKKLSAKTASKLADSFFYNPVFYIRMIKKMINVKGDNPKAILFKVGFLHYVSNFILNIPILNKITKYLYRLLKR